MDIQRQARQIFSYLSRGGVPRSPLEKFVAGRKPRSIIDTMAFIREFNTRNASARVLNAQGLHEDASRVAPKIN